MQAKFILKSRIEDVSLRTNRTFKIHIHGNGYHNYVGFQGLVDAVGIANAVQSCERALSSLIDNPTRKLRGGIRIDFYQI